MIKLLHSSCGQYHFVKTLVGQRLRTLEKGSCDIGYPSFPVGGLDIKDDDTRRYGVLAIHGNRYHRIAWVFR